MFDNHKKGTITKAKKVKKKIADSKCVLVIKHLGEPNKLAELCISTFLLSKS